MGKAARTVKRIHSYLISETQTRASADPDIKVRARSSHSRQSARARTRVFMCAVVFVFMFSGLLGRLYVVSFKSGDTIPRFASVRLADAPRPEIEDRNGNLLATDLPIVTLEIAGREIWDAEETVSALVQVLPDLNIARLTEKLEQGRYVEVQVDLTPAQQSAIFDLGLPGIRFVNGTKRIYPHMALAAHVVGHEERGKGGVMGLEKLANEWRAPGAITSSIDMRVQLIVERELNLALEKFKAKAAWGAVMNVRTGEVVALASLPDFDPNHPGIVPPDYRRNRATYDRYELGSAFKSITAAAAIDAGTSDESKKYDARGTYRIADRVISDFHGENRILTLSEVIQYSSNIGMARVAVDLGVKRQKHYLEALGLFSPLDIELSENRNTQLPRRWGPVEAATISYGHGISVTPLHLLAAFSATVNDGQYHSPTFLKQETAQDGAQVFKPETSLAMRRILRNVVTSGTAKKAEAQGYFPVGKTATADKPSPSGGYNRNTRIASFVGAFPGYAPEYAVIVSLDEPQPLKETYNYATAGWNAAPTFSRIVEYSAPMLGVAAVDEAEALAGFMGFTVTEKEFAQAASEALTFDKASSGVGAQ